MVPLVVLIFVHALVTLAYAALANSREPLLREQIETEADAPPRLHITYQLSLLLLRFAIAALAVTTLAQSLALTLLNCKIRIWNAVGRCAGLATNRLTHPDFR